MPLSCNNLGPPVVEYDESKVEEERKSSSNESDICRLCSITATVFDAENGEIICSTCGMVIYHSVESLSPERRSYSIGRNGEITRRTGIPSSLAFHDKGLSTSISHFNTDAYGAAIKQEQKFKMQRMRRWNNISNNNRSYYRNLKNAFTILNTVRDKLSLTDTIIEKSAYYYRKAVDEHIIKGRSISAFIVASIYAACRKLNVPRSLVEISNAANIDHTFAAKCYRTLIRYLKLNLPVTDSNIYVSKIANKARVSGKTYRRALEILKVIKENPISYGKDPNALAVAVLYTACLKEGEKVAQSHIAAAGNISVVTLKKRALDVIGAIS
jgi:transcription initiation factor TFIIB